jgi:hypothetical protein
MVALSSAGFTIRFFALAWQRLVVIKILSLPELSQRARP